MADDFERALLRRMADEERGTWRDALRADYGPWFDDLFWGFQCGEGWRDIVCALTATIAQIVGGPDNVPDLRVVQIKEKLGTLRYYVRGLRAAHSEAVDAAIHAAEIRSAEVCEVCGKPGTLRESRDGWWHTACDRHALN